MVGISTDTVETQKRFKSEYQTLAVKYNEDSKQDAERMIKSIELEFMQKY